MILLHDSVLVNLRMPVLWKEALDATFTVNVKLRKLYRKMDISQYVFLYSYLLLKNDGPWYVLLIVNVKLWRYFL